MRLLLLIPALLSSCTFYHDGEVTLMQPGGNIAWRKGVGLVAKNERSFDRAMDAAETGMAVVGGVKINASNQATKQVEAKELTSRNVTNQAASVEKAGIEARTSVTSQAISEGAEVLPVALSPP